jgi:hypothetical protein
MLRLLSAGLLAMAMFVLSTKPAQAGSVHLGLTKPEVQAARIRLYEHEVSLRDQDPTSFDHKYPVLGKVLASEQGYDEFLSDHTFQRLLCVHTPFIWRVIDGDTLYHRIHPFDNPPLVPPGGPTVITIPPIGGNTPGGGESGNPGGSGGPGGGGTFQVNSVPEPSSWVLLASAVAVTLIGAIRRRIHE